MHRHGVAHRSSSPRRSAPWLGAWLGLAAALSWGAGALSACRGEEPAATGSAEVATPITPEPTASIPEPPPLDVALLRRHLVALSDDAMQGRRPGTEGGAKAVAYLVDQLRTLGLQPAGEQGGFTQAVPMRAVRVDPTRSSLTLTLGDDPPVPLRAPEEIVALSMGPAGTTQVQAPLVFVGYGVTAPEYDWDDYAEADVRGAIVVALVGDPPLDDGRFEGPSLTYYGRWTYKLERAREAGAVGCLIVHETEPASYGWNVVESSWSGDRFALRDDPDTPSDEGRIEGWIHRDLAERIAAHEGSDLATWHADALRPGVRARRLTATLDAELITTERSLTADNVLAMVPGRTRTSEQVLITAHWDHLGVDVQAGADPSQDAIFNGAIDNASGLAVMLGLAAGLQAEVRAGQGPDRNVLLLATTAEEQNLLGSRHYAAHPRVPLSSIVAVLNLDSMHVHGRTTTIEVAGKGRTTIEDTLAEIAATQGRTLVAPERAGAGTYFRSDHFSFARRGIPAIFFRGGPALEDGGLEAGLALRRRQAERYHTVRDEYDPSWPLTGTLQDAETVLALVLRIADARARPRWKPGQHPPGAPAQRHEPRRGPVELVE